MRRWFYVLLVVIVLAAVLFHDGKSFRYIGPTQRAVEQDLSVITGEKDNSPVTARTIDQQKDTKPESIPYILGRVIDAHWGEPLENAEVFIRGDKDNMTLSDEKGLYRLPYSEEKKTPQNTRSYHHTVIARMPGYVDREIPWPTSTYTTRGPSLALTALQPFTGVVLDNLGETLDNVDVHLLYGSHTIETSHSNQAGLYALDPLADTRRQSARVIFHKPGYSPKEYRYKTLPIKHEVVLEPANRSILFRSVDRLGKPLSGLDVKVNSLLVGQTNAQGRFRFYVGKFKPNLTISAPKIGYFSRFIAGKGDLDLGDLEIGFF